MTLERRLKPTRLFLPLLVLILMFHPGLQAAAAVADYDMDKRPPGAEILTGEGQGYQSQIVVDVAVMGHEIIGIAVTDHGDTLRYMNRARAVLGQIVEIQRTDVDVVSGATLSSQGLIEAVEDALSGR